MKKANVRVIAVEAGKTISFDRQDMIAIADRSKISITGIKEID